MTSGCHRLSIHKLEIAKNYKGEYIHDEGNCLAFDVTFINKAGATIKMRMWNTEAGRWVSDALLRSVGMDPRKHGGYNIEDVYGKELYACVAATMHSVKGKPIGNPISYEVLPNTLSPVRDYDTETPYYKGDPLKGENPIGSKFIILKEIQDFSEEKVEQKSLFEEEDPFL